MLESTAFPSFLWHFQRHVDQVEYQSANTDLREERNTIARQVANCTINKAPRHILANNPLPPG